MRSVYLVDESDLFSAANPISLEGLSEGSLFRLVDDSLYEAIRQSHGEVEPETGAVVYRCDSAPEPTVYKGEPTYGVQATPVYMRSHNGDQYKIVPMSAS